MKLYESNMLAKEDPSGFLMRLIFDIALVTSWIPETLCNLEVKDDILSRTEVLICTTFRT